MSVYRPPHTETARCARFPLPVCEERVRERGCSLLTLKTFLVGPNGSMTLIGLRRSGHLGARVQVIALMHVKVISHLKDGYGIVLQLPV